CISGMVAADSPYQPVHTHVINPKAITLGELYGEYNLATNEWQDGLASSIIRTAVEAGQHCSDLQWVIFDGPVDTVWVENMNTVLDDNCMLCLPNGERIKLNPVTMRMLFEVADLAAASPATVSRCGMVYITPDDMGWRPYVRSWLDALPANIMESFPPDDGHVPLTAELTLGETSPTSSYRRSTASHFDFLSLSLAHGATGRTATGAGGSPSHSIRSPGSTSGGDGAAMAAAAAAAPTVRPSEGVVSYLSFLFDRFLEPLLVHVRRRASHALSTCEIALVASTCALLESLLLSTQFQGHP
ncbi:hypothetical protein Vretifemale_7225, partial [Volvox reticuliferus]